MENLNAEQIIKALECCGAVDADISTCDRCPFEPKEEGKGSLGCNDELIRNALSLINSQEQRIGELECKVEEHRADAISWQATVEEISKGDKTLFDTIDALRRKSREYDELNLKAFELEREIKELTEDNERLRAENEIKSQKRANIFEISNAFDRGRTKGVQKMQEILCDGRVSNDPVVIAANVAVKEMLEGIE